MKILKPFVLAVSVAMMSTQVLAAECRKPWRTARISAVGDILVHKAIYESVVRSRSRFSGLWGPLIPKLKNADLMVGNLEGPTAPGTAAGGKNVADPGFVYDGYVYSGTDFVFNYHPYLLDDLKSSGFDMLTTANNHTMDRGALGADRTIEQLEKRSFEFVGTRKNGSTQDTRSRIMKVKGLKIGMISCTESLNGQPDRGNQVLSCNSGAIVSMIAQLRRQTHGVIVFPHWGSEYQGNPNSGQKSLARKWVAAGATAIIGNHPHVLQTTEWLQRPSGGRSLVIYSLGNFVAGQADFERRVSAIAHLDVKVENGELQVIQFSYSPIVRPSGSASLDFARAAEESAHVERQLGPAVCR